MRRLRLGSSSIDITEMGFGCMGMSDFYGRHDDEHSIEVLHSVLDAGINFFDTADMYGTGHNEILLSRVLRSHRDQMVIATKFGNMRRIDGVNLGICGKPDYVKSACEMSLRRLNIDVIDLYYQHRVDPEVPIEDTVGAMADLVKAGKVRAIGLSEAAPNTIRRAHAVHPISALQTEYSLWSREPEDEILGVCRELGITFVAYSPLGRGFLTGQIKSIDDLAPDDTRRMFPRFNAENFPKNLQVVEAIRAIAAEKGATPAQLALAWVMAQSKSTGVDIVPIPGTRSEDRVRENLGALDLVLTREDMDRIEEVSPAVGSRYPEMLLKRVNL